MFNKILIANRGEIACRIARTARRLGIRTVAVYARPDRDARHTHVCDEALEIICEDPLQAYLDTEALIAIAKQTGVEAVHPGYGFLSENPQFAQAVANNAIRFIGPSPAAIRCMGDKILASKTVRTIGVPMLPSTVADDKNEKLYSWADETGYPVLIKPSAGGGGKGMHIADNREQLTTSVQRAKREALNAFGNAQLLIEKYLPRARHIEVQIFSDRHGNTVHLFERDCSIQRRHQKILEESPGQHLSPQTLQQLYRSATMIAETIGYEGAGTVEFLVADEAFYFLEMNTRLQVEHAVTEQITGLDLVEWQLLVASGKALPCRQEDIQRNGHSIEARIYAEDVPAGFLPSTGRVEQLTLPGTERHRRIDSGVTINDFITPHFDPMLMKFIATGNTRAQTIYALNDMLTQCHIIGVKNNVAFLQKILNHDDYLKGYFDTRFIETAIAELTGQNQSIDNTLLALGTVAWLLHQRRDGVSAWHTRTAWRLNAKHGQKLHLLFEDRPVALDVVWLDEAIVVTIDGAEIMLNATLRGAIIDASVNGARIHGHFSTNDKCEVLIRSTSNECRFRVVLASSEETSTHPQLGGLTAPMPGTIQQVLVKADQHVRRGDVLMIMEAMKMEHSIIAPASGYVRNLRHTVGDKVEAGIDLMTIEPQSSSDMSQ